MKFQEVVLSQSPKLDEHNRQVASPANFLKDVSVNPDHVVEVVSVPARLIEGQGSSPSPLTKLVTVNREIIVFGASVIVEEKIFGSAKGLLKG